MRARLLEVIEKHWGYNSFRPLQEEAMTAVLSGRDSVVVMPTGGGKSLCYQVPALLREGVTVVVSPLISLMKDQVDALRACGVPATQMNSSQSALELRALEKDLFDGKIRIVFVSPERLAMPGFRQTLQKAGVVFHDWHVPHGYAGRVGESETIARFVTSFATSGEEIERLGRLIL